MIRLLRTVFSSKMAIMAGILVVTVLTILILLEDSVQPMQDSYRANEIGSLPLTDGVRFTQSLSIPVNLEGVDFLIGLFFICPQNDCSGTIKVTLQQGEHKQVSTSTEFSPSPTLRYRFPFSGFSAGTATLEIEGHPQNDTNAPSLLYSIGEDETLLSGPGIQPNANASLDWFKIVNGNEKLGLTFPNPVISCLWLLSFAGFIALAWRGMRFEGSKGRINRG